MKNRWLGIIVFCALFLFYPSGEASALSCAELDGPEAALEASGAAVYGEVMQVKDDIMQEGFRGTKEYVTNVLIQVEKSWNIEVDSQLIAAADYTWGYDYREGESYLIFLTDDKGRQRISPCSPTIALASVEEAAEWFGEGHAPVKQVDLAYRMLFMHDKDIDLAVFAVAVLAVGALLLWRVSMSNRRRRGSR